MSVSIAGNFEVAWLRSVRDGPRRRSDAYRPGEGRRTGEVPAVRWLL
jgi:hypothetical protein